MGVCDDRYVSIRRKAVVGAIVLSVLLVGGVGVLAVSRMRNGDPSSPLENQAIAAVLPAACRMQAAIDTGSASRAFNIFWDDVHTDAHILAARLDAKDRAQGAHFREAKGFIERDLGTLSIVGLQEHVPAFRVEVRRALRALALPGADAPCP